MFSSLKPRSSRPFTEKRIMAGGANHDGDCLAHILEFQIGDVFGNKANLVLFGFFAAPL